MSCPYIFYYSKTHDFLSTLEKRVRLGATYYLSITLPETKAKAKIEHYSAIFKIDRSSSLRSRLKKTIPPVDLLVLQNRNLQQAGLVTLVFLFHLDKRFFIVIPEADRFSAKGSAVLNELFKLERKEIFKSVCDTHNRLIIYSWAENELVPVYTLHKMEIPQRLRGKYENYSSHQWVVRLHKDFITGKIKKVNGLFEKARNLPKQQESKSTKENKNIKEKKQISFYSRITFELEFLEKMYPSFGVQEDVSFIKKIVFKKNRKAHKGFSFNFTHPLFRSINGYNHKNFEALVQIKK